MTFWRNIRGESPSANSVRQPPGRAARLAKRGLLVIAALLVATELLYVIGANLFLSLGGIAKLFEATNTINAKFERAWTIWPGHVQIRNLRVVFQDVNLQWSLDMAKVSVVLDLSELASRTFHASSVQGEGTVFRFRHRVDPWSANEPSVQVLPQIVEFPGTAVFEATVPPAPITDAEYNLWTVHLEQVDAGVSEVWMQQFRYLGSGRARGAFRLRAARSLWVGPASLDLEPGAFTAGSYEISPRLAGRITCTVHPFDVREPDGREVLRFISSHIQLNASNLSLAAIRLFLPEENAAIRADGGNLRIDARTDHGKLSSSSRLELTQHGLLLDHPGVKLALGRGSLVARATPQGHGETLLELHQGQLSLPGSATQPLTIEHLQVSATSSSVDTTADWSLLEANLLQSQISVPDVGWFNGLIHPTGWVSSGGASELSVRARYKDGELEGDARASLENVRANSAQIKGVIDGEANLAWSKIHVVKRSGLLSGNLIGKQVRLEQGGTVFEANGIRIDAQAQTLDGAGRGSLTATLGTLRASDGKRSIQVQGELKGDLEASKLERGTASTRFTGELKNLELRALDQGLKARARRASVIVETEPTRLSLDARLHRVALEQGVGEDQTLIHANQLFVSSRFVSRTHQELDATLRSTAQGLRAERGRTRFKASPDLHVSVKGFNQQKRRGQIHGDLVVREFSASDIAKDADCPWSRIDRSTLRADAALQGQLGARVRLAGELSGVRLVWGDFSTTASEARFETDFDQPVSTTGTGRLLVALGLRQTELHSGPGMPLGWNTSLPVLDFSADLNKSGTTFGGPLVVSAERVQARIGRTTFHADLGARISLANLQPSQQVAIGGGVVQIRRLGLKVKDDEVKDWWADVNVGFLNISAKENLDLASAFEAKFRDALPALTVLAAQGDLPGWVPDLFPLRDLEATGTVTRRCRLTDFHVSELNGGPLTSTGRVQSVTDRTSGAFLVQLQALNPISAGLSFDEENSDFSLFAGNDWLTNELRVLDERATRKEHERCIPVPQECGNESPSVQSE